MPSNAECDRDYVLREYCCPGCGTALTVDVQNQAEAPLWEVRFTA